MKKGLAFYQGDLGFEVVEEADIEPGPETKAITQLPKPSAASVLLSSAWGYLELFEFKNPVNDTECLDEQPVHALGLRHICLAVDDCQLEYERLKTIMNFHCKPQNLGYGPEGDGPWVTYGRDPFGNIIEFWQLTTEDPPLHAPRGQ
jgi:catechol 2,3-dioxygenase-like lactoylglutathione lyase family enzyme